MGSMSCSTEERTNKELYEIFKVFDIRKNPEKYQLSFPPGILRKASVLIALQQKNGEYHVMLTLRSEDLTHHAGKVAFPGGMQDKTDTDEIHTALREAEEEIGLKSTDIHIIGVFSPGIVSPNSLVYPVLGIVSPDFVPVANPKEVSLVFSLPLKRFLLQERTDILDFQSSVGDTYHIHHFYDTVDGTQLDTYGFTANYCIMVALGVYQSDQTFCFHNNLKVTKYTLFQPNNTRQIISKMTGLNLSKL